MLTLWTGGGGCDCQGLRRREFLRIGSLTLGGLSLSGLLQARAAAAEGGAGLAGALKDRAVVLLFLAGGASHIETFDPRMDAPEGVRSVTGELATTIPGVTFGGTCPQLAARAHKLAVVRSFSHTISDHAKAIHHVLTAGNVLGAGMGALYARIRGANDPMTAMPTHGLVTTEEIDPSTSRRRRGSRNRADQGPWAALMRLSTRRPVAGRST
jgi:hypothetical protein